MDRAIDLPNQDVRDYSQQRLTNRLQKCGTMGNQYEKRHFSKCTVSAITMAVAGDVGCHQHDEYLAPPLRLQHVWLDRQRANSLTSGGIDGVCQGWNERR